LAYFLTKFIKLKVANKHKIFVIKLVHTIIYIFMVIGIFYILFAAITKTYDIWLYVSLALLILESIIYFANGRTCPFTNLAKKYGDEKGYVGDLFMPKSVADNTFYLFGTLFVLGLVILLLNFFALR